MIYYRNFSFVSILIFFLQSIGTSLFADQLELLSKEQAEKARQYLVSQINVKPILLFCGCCGKDTKEYVTLADVTVVPDEKNRFRIKIDGVKESNGKLIFETVDLAYVWVQKGNMAACLGKELGFDCDPCVTTFNWEGEPNKVTTDSHLPSTSQSSLTPIIAETNPVANVNELVRKAGVWISNKPREARKAAERKFDSTLGDGKIYQIVEKKYNRYENMESFAVIEPNRGSLWAGELIQGRDLEQGQLTPLGKFSRAPITITISGSSSRNVIDPSYANVNKAIREILSEEKAPNSAQIYMNVVEQRSMSQARCDLSAKIGFLPFSFEGKFSNNHDDNSNSIYLVFKQTYYTISSEDPSSPTDFFGKDINIRDLQQKIYTGNPLCYISSVSYGRLIIAKFTSKSTVEDMKAAAQASFGKTSVFNVSGSYKAQSSLENATCEVLVIGGSSQNSASAVAQLSFNALLDLIKTDSKPTADAQGEPISYAVRFVADNSIARIGQAGEYSVIERELKRKYFNVEFRDFTIFRQCTFFFAYI